MKHIRARIAVSTWQDVFNMMSAVLVVNYALLVIYLLVNEMYSQLHSTTVVSCLTELPFSRLVSFPVSAA